MSAEERSVLSALLRRDLAAFTQRCFQTVVPGQEFLPNWHIEAIAHHLELCRSGHIQRLIVTLPPRNLKSICASVATPLPISALMPRPTAAGVLGIARMIAVAAPNIASKAAIGVPAAIDRNTVPCPASAASCGAASAIICGLTAMTATVAGASVVGFTVTPCASCPFSQSDG